MATELYHLQVGRSRRQLWQLQLLFLLDHDNEEELAALANYTDWILAEAKLLRTKSSARKVYSRLPSLPTVFILCSDLFFVCYSY